MAITINDQPYKWAVRGQKLMIIAISDEVTNDGFKYGVQLIIQGVPYQFYLNPAPDDRLYFDCQPLLDSLRNYEPLNYHLSTDNTVNDLSNLSLTFTLTENWLVDGVFTLNAGSQVNGDDDIVINGYYQSIEGFKPSPEVGNNSVK